MGRIFSAHDIPPSETAKTRPKDISNDYQAENIHLYQNKTAMIFAHADVDVHTTSKNSRVNAGSYEFEIFFKAPTNG
jgi:hypothetical protein